MNRVLLVPTVVLILLGVTAFLMTRGEADTTKRPIVVCNAAQVKTLDPARMSWSQDIRTAMGLWEGLATYDPETLKPIPGVAEKWDISDDKKEYTFHLRADARWSNGDPVVAGDFIFAWKRVLEPATGADYVNLFYPIEGAEEYINAGGEKKHADFSRVGIKTPDDHTIVIKLAFRCDYFLDLVAFPTFYPLHRASMEKYRSKEEPTQFDSRWVRPPGVVTNGPFKFDQWEFKRYVRLKANEFYWDRANVKADEVLVTVIEEERTALLAYEHGDVDLLTFVPQDFGDIILAQRDAGKRHDVHFRPVFGTYYYLFNCVKPAPPEDKERPPFWDKRVRKALNLAIDKEKIVKNVTRMGQTVSGVLVPVNSVPGYTGPRGLEMNIPEAKRLLADAGYPDGKNFPVVEIFYNKQTIHEKVAQAIGQMWQQNLGIAVKYRGIETSAFGAERNQHDFEVARGGWYGDYVDPTTWLDLAVSNDENNDGGFKSDAYDALLKRAASLSDKPAERMATLAEAEKMLVEDECPFIPLYQYSDGYIFDQDKIGGVEANLRLMMQLKYICRKGK